MSMPAGPYSDAFDTYWRAGWHGILPLPPKAKTYPPRGFTGEAGGWPSYADCQTWADNREGAGNLALRLPHHVLGVDVDNYDNKPGAATLAAAEQKWGPLPPTWRTTSRNDGTSGIRLYRIPEGLAWPGELGPATELIQHKHRYAIAWPSIHPEGRTYRWISPDGVASTVPPNVDNLPRLPETWIEGLTGGELAADTTRNTYNAGQVSAWIAEHNIQTAPCRRMTSAGASAVNDLGGNISRHVAGRDGVLRLIRLAEQGHHGLIPTLSGLHKTFLTAATNPARAGQTRTTTVAEHEWLSLLLGAVNLVSANPSTAEDCDCDPARLIAPPTAASGSEAHTTHGAATGAVFPDAVEHTSWWPRELNPILEGREPEQPPTHLLRDDNTALFYPAAINGLLGESESGKSWVALMLTAQRLNAGHLVAYLDFEDVARNVVARLRTLGVTREQFQQFRYIGPDEALHALAAADLQATINEYPDTIIVDGFNAAMTLLELKLESNVEVTKFFQTFLKPLTAGGACVVYIDHVPKNPEARGKGGIGAQAKRAMTSGTAFLVEVKETFGRGMRGKLTLTIDKDRPGHVRGSSNGCRAGFVHIDSTQTDIVSMMIEAPEKHNPDEPEIPFRPTVLMQRVSCFLETVSGGASQTAIEKAVVGKVTGIRKALDRLVEEGYAERETAGQTLLTKIIHPYREIADGLIPPAPSSPVQPRPTPSHPVPGRG